MSKPGINSNLQYGKKSEAVMSTQGFIPMNTIMHKEVEYSISMLIFYDSLINLSYFFKWEFKSWGGGEMKLCCRNRESPPKKAPSQPVVWKDIAHIEGILFPYLKQHILHESKLLVCFLVPFSILEDCNCFLKSWLVFFSVYPASLLLITIPITLNFPK